MRPALSSLVVALAAVVACGDPAPEPDGSPEPPSRAEDAVDTGDAVDTVDAIEPVPVRVWFSRDGAVVPVPRPDVDRSLRGALESLLAGPRPEERSEGLTSWFDQETRDMLEEVRLDSTLAIVDFRGSLPTVIPGAGSSAGSEALLAALDSTVFQFPSVEAVEYRLDGSCEAFWSWLQRACAVVRRP